MASKKTPRSVMKVSDPVVLEFMQRFEFYYQEMHSDLDRLKSFQNMYDNIVNSAMWPTQTELPIPFLFAAVHDALPGAMDYMFPRSKWINLIPQDPMDGERVQNMEWALQLQLMHRMKLAWNCYPSIHSCFKCGVGYGAIEPFVSTPPEIYSLKAFSGDRQIRSARQLGPGRPRLALRYVDVNAGEIVVSKDGSEFNGNKRVSHAFRFQTYSEQAFRQLYSGVDAEAVKLKGNVDEIIEEARNLGFLSNTNIESDIARLAGVDSLALSKKKDQRIPVRVPVLKVYTENRHLWIANGTTIIYDAKDTYQTMMTPLIKWSAWPDGDRWFPVSAPEVASKPALGLNLWINLMHDVFTESAKPVMVYNKTALGNSAPERGPNGTIGVAGDVRQAATYLEKPQMDAGSFQILDVMQRWYGHASGRQIGDIAPGMLRAGANAFEGVLQSTRGRERLANYLLEMGAIEDIVRSTLIHMQSMAEPDTFIMREWNEAEAKEYDRRFTITQDDLTSVYDIQLDLSEKHRASAMDQQMRMAEFNALSNNPYADQYENIRSFISDDYRFRRMMPPRARVRQMQEEERQAKLLAAQQGAGQTAAPGTQVEAEAAGLNANV
jgi:hypothetical protein